MTRLVVLRGTVDEVGCYDGWWFDLDTMSKEAPSLDAAVFEPTGERETRADSVEAEVYRRKPIEERTCDEGEGRPIEDGRN